VLGISGGILIAAGPVTAFVLARLSASRLLGANLVALGVDVVLAIVLIPPLDAWGAVIANVAGAGTRLAILLWGEVHALDLSWRHTAAQGRPAVLGALACGGAWLLTEALPWPPLTEAVVGGASAAVVFFASLAVTRSGLTGGDAEAIARNIPKRAAGAGALLLRLLVRNPS
jgi:peptidoglycan biosynthesis protein MviN/MurJ (putative lipid II flippase)